MKKIAIRLFLLVLIGGAGWAVYHYFKGLPSRQAQTPVTKVRQGDVVVRTFTRGELRAVRSATLSAPNLFGSIQVTKLAPLGASAKEKNLIVEFDDSEVVARLEQKQLELEQFDEQIKKSQADLAIRNNQDQVDLLRARYSVRRAQLEVKRNEILSEIDQKKNNLKQSEQALKQLESDIKSKQDQAQAELNVLMEKRRRSLLDIQRERMRLAQVKLLSPISGLVAIKQNRSGFGGMFGTAVPDIREGDQLQPGIPVAEVLDLSELEVTARVGELDRANLKEGQEVLMRLDALSDKVFNGKIKSMSGTASANVFSSDPGKKFDVVFSIDMHQLLTALGAKPEQIAGIMRMAEENRKKPISVTQPSMMAMMPGFDAANNAAQMPGGMAAMGGGAGGGGPQMVVMQAGAGGQDGGQGGRQGGFGGGDRPQMSDEQRQKMREAMQKALNGRNMQDLSPEERQQLFAKIREQMGGGAAKKSDDKKGDTKQADGKKSDSSTPGAPQAMAFGFGGPGGGPGGGNGRRGGGMDLPPVMGGGGTFSQKDLDSAELPPAPGEDSNLDVLLRPGLLADVEIIVEKVPNAIYLPNQVIFEKDGKPVVYVKSGDRFEPREVQISKRSESVSILSGGVRVGETVAMSDPTAKPGQKKQEKKEGGSGAAGALPVGGSGGGAR